MDLENSDLYNLLNYKQLWVLSTEFMDTDTQQKLADYVKSGGNMIIYPVIPSFDLYLNKCEVLKNELNINFSIKNSSHKVSAFGIDEVFTNFPQKQIFTATDDESIAFTKDKDVCGIKKKIGNGQVTILGFAFGYSSDEHLKLCEKILKQARIKKEIEISDSDIQYVVRESNKIRYTFFINYHNQKKKFYYKFNYKNRKSKSVKRITLNPYSYKIIRESL